MYLIFQCIFEINFSNNRTVFFTYYLSNKEEHETQNSMFNLFIFRKTIIITIAKINDYIHN